MDAVVIDGVEYRRAPGPPGRPYIGRKAQAHVDDSIHDFVGEEAKRRQVRPSVIWRELIEEAARERYGYDN